MPKMYCLEVVNSGVVSFVLHFFAENEKVLRSGQNAQF